MYLIFDTPPFSVEVALYAVFNNSGLMASCFLGLSTDAIMYGGNALTRL